jgi:hypothetical protein
MKKDFNKSGDIEISILRCTLSLDSSKIILRKRTPKRIFNFQKRSYKGYFKGWDFERNELCWIMGIESDV